MTKTAARILEAARIADLRESAEKMAAAVKPMKPLVVPRMPRRHRRLVLWLIMQDHKRSSALMEFLD